MAQTIVGYFPSWSRAETAVIALQEAGFKPNEIGIATRSSRSTSGQPSGQDGPGIWDKVKSFFEGNRVEPYATEASREPVNEREVTPEFYDSQDVHRSLGVLSVADENARYFNHRLGTEKEGTLVTVNASGREDQAVQILEENGGDLGKGAAQFEYGAETSTLPEEQNIQLYGEVLRVQKERVSRGEVRLRKEVHTTTQTVEVPVTREELVIERVPVSGEVAATGSAFSEHEIRIPLSEERASVEKQAVVREEVRVGKKEVAGVESFDEQVRSEDLKIDQDLKHKRA